MPSVLDTIKDQNTRDLIAADAGALLRDALALQGLAALDCQRDHAALHEAGHCAAHFQAGERIRWVKVFPRQGQWLGRTMAGPLWQVTPDTPPPEDLKRARILLAGPAAELILSGHPAVAAGIDEIATARAIVGNAANKLETDPQALMVATMTETLIMLASYRPGIEAIAARLMKVRKLDGRLVAYLLQATRRAAA